MAVPWKYVAAGGLVLGGLAALLRATHKSTSTPPKRVALIGDSYAVGLGPELAKIFPEFKYAGVVGTNSTQWATHSAACGTCGDWLTAFKPDVVLVSLGVNDGATPNATNYQTLVRGLHGLGARVVWIEPPDDVRNANATRQIVDSLGVQEVHTKVPLASDGLHPTGAGYAQWAKEIAAAVLG
jgi:lysophospholipase L1-like esterase